MNLTAEQTQWLLQAQMARQGMQYAAQQQAQALQNLQQQGGIYGTDWQAAQTAHYHSLTPGTIIYAGAGIATTAPGGAGTYVTVPFGQTCPQPEPLENAGISAGEILAWRCWRVKHGFLCSMYANDVWAPGEPMKGDPASTGVHAFKTQKLALQYGIDDNAVVVGTVELWGEVIEHETGYRAEYGQVASLDHYLNKGFFNGRKLRKLRKKYLT